MRFIRNSILIAMLLSSTPGLAQTVASGDDARTGTRPWALGLAGQLDDESNDSLFATFNWGVAENTWLSFIAGRSHSPRERADVSVQTLSASVDHRVGTIGLTFEVERWGDRGAVESDDLNASVYFQGDRLRVGVQRERRDIDITFSTLGQLDRIIQRKVGLTADGTGLSLGVQLADNWHLYLAGMNYDYSRNLSLLPRVRDFNLLSGSTLTLANSFLDVEATLGLEVETGNRIINLSVTSDRSAVDRSRLTSFNAAVLFPVSRRIDIEVNIGKSDSDLVDSSVYGGIMLLIYGG